MELFKVYSSFLKEFGPQGWWPVTENNLTEYHKNDYSYPKNEMQQWEICTGAILTQNTNWKNVEKALENMRSSSVLYPEDILKTPQKKLEALVHPSGFFRQKAERLRVFSSAVEDYGGIKFFMKNIPREELLSIKGIGPETADSMLLYAGKRPFFVVDAYTRRIFSAKGLLEKTAPYEHIRQLFESSLPRDWRIYNEFHALIVEKAKRLLLEKRGARPVHDNPAGNNGQ